MAKMNYSRPCHVYSDNLKKVRARMDSLYKDSLVTGTLRQNTVENKSILRQSPQAICLDILDKTEIYYNNFSKFLKKFTKKSKKKINIKEHEENLRESIRVFFIRYKKETNKNNLEGAIYMAQFIIILTEELPSDDLLIEMINQEYIEI